VWSAVCGDHEASLSWLASDEIVRPELGCWQGLGFANTRPTYAELKNAGDHDDRSPPASIL
jgi:hypothetical protein